MDIGSLERLAFRAKVARWSLVAIFATFALTYGLAIVFVATGGFSPTAAMSLGFAGLLPYIALLVFVIAYFLWLQCAARNLHESAEGVRYSPVWHVASYFVPLANLYMPFAAMRELWNRSHGEPPELADAGVGPVASWWTCWVAATLLLTATLARMFLTAYTNVIVMVPPLLDLATMGLTLLLLIGASWFLFGIIGTVTRAQTGYLNVGATFA